MMETENKQEDVGLFQDRDFPNGKLNRHRVEVQEGMRREVPGEKSLDSEDHRKEAGEGCGMMEAPGDGSGWEARTLNGGKDLWTPGLGRESKLEVVKSGSSYDIRAYKGERKPSRLYGEEEEEERRYKIPLGDASPGRVQELEEERQEVIRSQAVKRRNTVAEKWGSPSGEAPGATLSRPAGFAHCFDSPSTAGGGRRAPADPQKVDTEQIQFAATRQQFLELEKANPGVVLWGAPWGPPKMARGVHRGEEGQEFLSQREAPHSDTPHRGRLGGSPERTERAWQTRGPTSSGQAATCPDTAGGDLASGSGKAPQEAGRSPRDLVAGGPGPTEGTETPIKREIRLGREREEDHRRERRLPRTHSREELVEIPVRPLLLAAAGSSSQLVSSSSSGKGKEKPLVSFCIQKEVEQDKKREEELRKEGRLPGGPWADKGSRQEPAQQQQQQQQLQRKVSFEQEVVVVEPPPNGEGPPAPGSHDTEGPGGRGAPEPARTSLDTEAGRGPLGEKEWPLAQPRPPTTTRRPMDPGSPTEGPSATQKLQVYPPGSQEGPNGRQETSRATAGRPAREELYTLRTWRPRTSALIDREIQEALDRERELQEQRRKTGLACPVDSPPFSSQSSVASGVAGSYSVAGSPVFSPTSPPLGRAASGTYAGIELEDEIDTEVVMSTKAICRRGFLAQMWESGQILKTEDDGPDGDDDDGSLDG
ncbi:hypothetical protein JRQ81_008812 [Phrynocephalus forsythii]|uniref:A-kinase anchor protein 2 C-terminal domain-containing protein n=1 Tax=Phrynocephalus forsythii TaxID=171643 RepID=A0A9Q0XE48_9SAUR|nr:hypothetical protein JRQ81_008812 [Phrynocephalus forsythii]